MVEDQSQKEKQCTSAREESKRLMDKRDVIDAQLAENEAVLKANNVDMDTKLVDEEGFPKAEIDVYSVRIARHAIITLRNDRKEITEKIEKLVHQIHEERREGTASGPAKEIPIVHRTTNKPFLRITSVRSQSPADQDGIKKGDEIIQFGPFHGDNFQKLEEVAKFVKDSLEKPIRVTILRAMRPVRVELKPRLWSGQGLIGCFFEALPK
uniref:Nas2_N domain-containing protein n=1 Tax=Steinernema glaseri TaxID=37863 RepID=A0A1I7YBJ3_9BILA